MAFVKVAVLSISVILMLLPTAPSAVEENCPRVPEKANESWPYPLNVRGNNSTKKSEFLCDFIWTDEVRERLEYHLHLLLKKRQIALIHFTVPVLGFNNPYFSMSNYSGTLTWTWVRQSHKDMLYMLYFPHNFIVLSAYTMSIITSEWPWVIDSGHCDPQCVQVNKSCGIGKYELEEVFKNAAKGKWDIESSLYCLQSSYSVLDIVKTPDYAFPDLLYYWRFLYAFFSKFGWGVKETDFPNYYCYNMNDNCYVEDLVSSYWVIPFIGLLLWLYSPLLIYYFPSSTARKNGREDKSMIPSHKNPMYLGSCLKGMLCFYKRKDMPKTKWFIRLRRLLFLIILAVPSFRLFIWPPYYYYSWPLLSCAAIAVLVPSYLSTHITAEIPSRFLEFTCVDENLVEYQQLAYVMLERIYLMVNFFKFWPHVFTGYTSSYCPFCWLVRKSRSYRFNFQSPKNTTKKILLLVAAVPAFVFSLVIFATAIFIIVFYYFFPILYFYKKFVCAVIEYIRTAWKPPFSCVCCVKFAGTLCHAIVMFGLVAYVFLVTYVWCYAISEFTLFTFIGSVLTARMIIPYFVLIGLFVGAIYVTVRELHKEYDHVLETIIDIFEKDKTFKKLASQVDSESRKLEKEENQVVIKRVGENWTLRLLIHEHIITYLNRDLYNDTVERCRPFRKQILFIVLKIMAIVFYCLVALWTKNVFQMEDKLGSIFAMVQAVAILLLPITVQLISYKRNFGKKNDIVLKQEIYESLVTYLSNPDLLETVDLDSYIEI